MPVDEFHGANSPSCSVLATSREKAHALMNLHVMAPPLFCGVNTLLPKTRCDHFTSFPGLRVRFIQVMVCTPPHPDPGRGQFYIRGYYLVDDGMELHITGVSKIEYFRVDSSALVPGRHGSVDTWLSILLILMEGP